MYIYLYGYYWLVYNRLTSYTNGELDIIFFPSKACMKCSHVSMFIIKSRSKHFWGDFDFFYILLNSCSSIIDFSVRDLLNLFC